MNILVTGANGDVCDGYPTLDITDLDAVRQVVAEEKIGCIINCAAWTNVDKAETAGDIVETLNAIAPENLARAMKEVGGLLVHVSTDYVFVPTPTTHLVKRPRREPPRASMGSPNSMARRRS